MNTLTFSLATIRFELQSADDSPPLLPPAYAPFITDSAGPNDAVYTVNLTDPALFPPIFSPAPPHLLWACETWRLGYAEDRAITIEIHNVNTDTWVPVAHLAPDFKTGRILHRSGRQALPAPFSLNYPIDQILVVNRLLHHRAGLVHASAVVLDGHAYLFCGPADIGKTTMARLWQQSGAQVLNDDRNIIRLTDHTVTISPSPWHGDLNEINPITAPLKAIFHLSQANTHQINPLDPVTALARLTATSVAPFYFKESLSKQLDTWSEVCTAVPSFSLAFTPNANVVDFCLVAPKNRAKTEICVITPDGVKVDSPGSADPGFLILQNPMHPGVGAGIS